MDWLDVGSLTIMAVKELNDNFKKFPNFAENLRYLETGSKSYLIRKTQGDRVEDILFRNNSVYSFNMVISFSSTY